MKTRLGLDPCSLLLKQNSFHGLQQSLNSNKFLTYKSNALTNPWAVVVKLVDTVVADGAVRGSWWAVPQTGLAKLHLHCEAIHNDILGLTKPHPWGSPIAPVHGWCVGAKQ